MSMAGWREPAGALSCCRTHMAPPTLLRRTAPVRAATAASAAGPLCFQPCHSLASPPCPPGFFSPRFAREDLVLLLFPQLAGSTPDPVLPPGCSTSPGSPFVPDPLPEDPPAAPASVAPGPARKVCFAAAEDLLNPAPAKLIHGAPRSCLKTARSATFSAGQGAARTPIPSNPATPRAMSFEPLGVDASSEEGWKLVKPPYWWRTLSPNLHQSRQRSSPSFSPPSSGRIFVKHHRRTCNRCLERGHLKIDCRDPYKCLICRQSGHRARQCTNKSPKPVQEHLLPPAMIPSPPLAEADGRILCRPCSGHGDPVCWDDVRGWDDGREGNQRSSAPARRINNRGQGSRYDRLRDDCDGNYDMRRGLELPTLDARRIDRGCVQRLPDGAVIPASGRRSRNRPADTPTRSARRRTTLRLVVGRHCLLRALLIETSSS
ncbi:hypothetical protein VPH35_002259 [Triticum aestivum]